MSLELSGHGVVFRKPNLNMAFFPSEVVMQVYLRDTVSSCPGHCRKVSSTLSAG